MGGFFDILYGTLLGDATRFGDADVYATLGYWTSASSLALTLFYYYVLGSVKRLAGGPPLWYFVLFANAALNALVGFEKGFGSSSYANAATLGFINGMFAVIFFGAFSMAIKWFSPHSSDSPF
ncbi:MAG: hypothetical protein GF419_10255 [Ignavibacteriales bacterium]|nr:hypothetical protein [Ignavibacteriales bacterium]